MRSLTAKEWLILRAARLDSRASASTIAKSCNIQAHTVHRVLGSLKERGVLTPFLLINPHVLGLTDYCIFLSLSGEDQNYRNKILRLCADSQYVSYCAELTGEFKISVSIYATSIFEVYNLLSEIEKSLGNAHVDPTFAIRLEWSLLSHNRSGTLLRRKTLPKSASIDSFDNEFLSFYSLNPHFTFIQIARELGVSEGTVRNRFIKLSESKVILGVPYWFTATSCGLFPFRLMIKTRGNRSESLKQLTEFARRQPKVTEFVHCIGGWDFEINFFVGNPLELTDFTQDLYDQLGSAVYSIVTCGEIAVRTMSRWPAMTSFITDTS